MHFIEQKTCNLLPNSEEIPQIKESGRRKEHFKQRCFNLLQHFLSATFSSYEVNVHTKNSNIFVQ